MDTVIDSLLGFVITGLKDMVMYNYHLISDAKDNANALCNEIEGLKRFIQWCKENYRDDEDFLRGLVDKVRRVVYQAEDDIETYIASQSRQHGRNFLSQVKHAGKYALKLRSVSKSIQAIQNEVERIVGRDIPAAIAMKQVEATRNRNPRRERAPVVNDTNQKMVGFDDVLKDVIELLKGESEEREVISITGLPGRGKTTLAKQVMNNAKIALRFRTRAFVHVSQEQEMKKVFIKILGSLTQIPPGVQDIPVENLIESIQKKLEEKYLIVLDDVPTPEAWKHLDCAFPNTRGSMILITTQSNKVASDANPRREPIKLRELKEEESKQLLRRKVFGYDKRGHQFQEYESQIIQKCEGLPLKIVLIAGVLRNDRENIDWWKKVAEGRYTSVASDVMGMCYEYLPSHLKPCLLYLGVFHEDLEIPVWKLLQLWVAEGFVKQDENSEMSLEDSAENYLRDLVQSNLVMVGQKKADGQNIKTCRIHGTLRDFCKEQAKKENLFQEPEDPLTNHHRRIFVNSQVKPYISNNFSRKHVRSFLSFDREECALETELGRSFPRAFDLLRVLDIRSIIFPNFPDELLQLVLLRYIAIAWKSDSTHPNISRLWRLQTLIIETDSSVLNIDANIGTMPQLRHLYTKAATHWSILPVNTENALCRDLRTLCRISPECCRNGVLGLTPNVRKLGIRGKLEPSLLDTISSLKFVENLELYDDTLEANSLKLQACPEWMNSLGSLRRLTLRKILLDSEQLSILKNVSNLLVLKLKENKFQEEKWELKDCSFPHLQVLQIEKADLVAWEASENSFPQLSRLVLRHCRGLKAIPLGFGHIKSLQNIDLYDVSDSVESDASKIQLLKIKMQPLTRAPQTGGLEPPVQPPQPLGSSSASTSKECQSDEPLATGNESQANGISPEPSESSGQEIQEWELQVSQNPKESKRVISNAHVPPLTISRTESIPVSGKELQVTTEVSQDSKQSSGGNATPAGAASTKKKPSRFQMKTPIKRLTGFFRKNGIRKNTNVV